VPNHSACISIAHALRHRAALALCGLLLASAAAHAEVFINELHYDDATGSGDTGEGVEVVASAGEDLAAYRLQLYNGSNPDAANLYDDRALPAGGAVSCGASVRIAAVSWPSNGLQNGAADGIALVDGGGALVQFISYEGGVTGADGTAAGRVSQDLPVSESNATPAGTSLQLQGNATGYAGFAWAPSSAATFGACNNGQSFGVGGDPQPAVTSTTPANGASDFPAAGDLNVAFSENVALSPGAFALSCSVSGAVTLSHGSSGSSFAIGTGTALRAGEVCTLTIAAASIVDGGGQSPAADTQVGFSVASGGGGSDDYYARVNTTSAPQLRCSLHQTIRGHTVYPYSGSGTSTWSILEIADEDPNDSGRILDVYRNRSYARGDDRAGTGSGLTYNREHTWPNSLGFGSATGDLGLPNAPYTDTHMLYLSDTTYNADRGNKPYADCASGCGERVTEANDGRGGGSGVYPGNSNWVQSPDGNAGSFQPWVARKGDVARAVMYMAIRYEGGDDVNSGQSEPDLELTDDRSRIVITSSSPAYMGLLSTLLAWHQADPPDADEVARNEVIYSFQGNRNPFIDHPEWATSELFTSTQPPVCELNE
jgi:endonuclease I